MPHSIERHFIGYISARYILEVYVLRYAIDTPGYHFRITVHMALLYSLTVIRHYTFK